MSQKVIVEDKNPQISPREKKIQCNKKRKGGTRGRLNKHVMGGVDK